MPDQSNSADASSMTDAELIAAWNAVENDAESLTSFEQSIIDEIERRNLDL